MKQLSCLNRLPKLIIVCEVHNSHSSQLMERETRLELATLSLEGWRSSQLSYSRVFMWLNIWWWVKDSNLRRHSQQIYSLPSLATWVTHHLYSFVVLLVQTLIIIVLNGAGKGTRTPDLLITNQLLYQLSYTSTITLKVVTLKMDGNYRQKDFKSQGFFEKK